MSFFGTIINKEEPFEIELEDGVVFHLTQAVFTSKSKATKKVYLIANVVEEYEMMDGQDAPAELEPEKITVCILNPDKVDQVALDLHFDSAVKVIFTIEGDMNAEVSLCGSMIFQGEEDGEEFDHDPDCSDEECEFGSFSDEEEMEEEIPQLKKNNAAAGKIKEIVEDAPVAKPQQPKKQPQQPKQQQQKPAAAEPKKQPQQPQQNGKKAAPQQQQQVKREGGQQPQKQQNKKAKTN
ncbi:hypothetical protein SAMD00019534_117660 [Acytostelium subglobosum LB1]|uniref:hypothetical protein n=1 Tax=Acytostelium subglobosum LB1 TaxID=1410327 RepID=UPI0006451D9F|nr:hypothetical protein SAMD00019534_117660 [Acytostelium subglobosum LB1]GAM28590.1 hypothetical protein SAMD00019534_117660 [Acytostelium subglobosum LB1]|eukprot:XP_012748368.1 hypothetical protein SAMD00019534_117660 [Acytostelium subglobosum LB1]